jgi:hypothetical protein
MLKIFVILLVVPFLYSCQSPVQAHESALKNQLAYAEVTKTKHTKHIRKKQRKICDRLRKIRERLEKRKKRKQGRKGGK